MADQGLDKIIEIMTNEMKMVVDGKTSIERLEAMSKAGNTVLKAKLLSLHIGQPKLVDAGKIKK